MRDIACGGDARLCEQRLVIADTKIGDRRTARDDFAKLRRGYTGNGACELNDGPDPRLMQPQSRHCADDAFAAYGRRFNRIAILQNDQQRDHPAERKENLIDLLIHVEQDRPLFQRDDGEMGFQSFVIGV